MIDKPLKEVDGMQENTTITEGSQQQRTGKSSVAIDSLTNYREVVSDLQAEDATLLQQLPNSK